jgi:hypothetical protein
MAWVVAELKLLRYDSLPPVCAGGSYVVCFVHVARSK